MPIYEYECPDCDEKFEQFKPVHASGEDVPCPKCATPAPRVVSRLACSASGCESAVTPSYSFG